MPGAVHVGQPVERKVQPVKPSRRQFVMVTGSAAVGALWGCTSWRSAETSDLGGHHAAACITPSSGNGLHYCLVEPAKVRVVDAATLAIGQAMLFNIDDATAVIVARDDRGFYALSGICTHQCCVLTVCDGDCSSLLTNPGDCAPTPSAVLVRTPGAAFFCACHGSEFAADGSVLSGPATDPLPAAALLIEGNDVIVDLGQIADPDRRTI